MRKKELVRENYRLNALADECKETTTENRLVTDQNGATGRAFVMGKYPAKHNACEAISLHNAKVLLGLPSRLSDAIDAMFKNGVVGGKGFFGVLPWRLGKVFEAEGLAYRKVKFDELSQNGIFVVSFWNKKPLKNGLHTVAAETKDGATTLFNYAGKTKLDEEMKKRYICGYKCSLRSQ